MKHAITTAKRRSHGETLGGFVLLLATLLLLGLAGCDQAYMLPGDEGGAGLEQDYESAEFGLRAEEPEAESEEGDLYEAPVHTGSSGFVIDYTRSERKAPGKNSATVRHPDPKPWH